MTVSDAELETMRLMWKFYEDCAEGKIPIDFGGHFNRSIQLDQKHFNERVGSAYKFNKAGLRLEEKDSPEKQQVIADEARLAQAYATKTPLAEPVKASTCFLCCRECGEELEFACDGLKIWCLNPCEYPDGYPAYEVEINVPSGLLVVGNDFRDVFPVAGEFNINEVIGCAETTRQYAKIGLAHAFVGNTCPGVYKINKESFVVGTCGGKKNPVKGSRHVASICTDLWWYSICDADEYCLQSKIEGEEKETFKKEGGAYISIVKCRPGVYRFKHQYHRLPDLYNESQVYTYVDWVREPDPVVDLQAEFKSLNFTAGQIVNYVQRYSWSEKSFQRIVDQLFFVLGNGIEAHPNGWLIPGVINNETELTDIELPVLDEQYSWYPFSSYSAICNYAGCADKDYADRRGAAPYLNESFTALLFNALRCIVVHGVKESEHNPKDMQKTAEKALKGLAKLYPDRIPENCKPLLSKKK